jgi:hypothetical protein
VAPPPFPHRRHRRHAAPGRVARGGKVEMVSVALAKKRSPTPTSSRCDRRAQGATDQDAAIGGEADRAGRGIVIVANKWDLVKTRTTTSSRRSTRRCGTDAVPRLRADPAHLGADRRAHAQVLETIDKVAAARRSACRRRRSTSSSSR